WCAAPVPALRQRRDIDGPRHRAGRGWTADIHRAAEAAGRRSRPPRETRLAAVHDGRDSRVGGSYPTEVQPLVDDLNALLAHREQRIRAALAKAGDLAHGLKTPLAVLAQEAERAAADGHHERAATLAQQVDRMRRQVEYHLAHARAAASGPLPGAHCAVAESAHGLARTLDRLPAARALTI